MNVATWKRTTSGENRIKSAPATEQDRDSHVSVHRLIYNGKTKRRKTREIDFRRRTNETTVFSTCAGVVGGGSRSFPLSMLAYPSSPLFLYPPGETAT